MSFVVWGGNNDGLKIGQRVNFWGSQWGAEGTDTNGYLTLSGDPDGVAPYLQAFIKGIGTDGETWSGVMTQYCQGVAVGTINSSLILGTRST